MFGVAWTVPEVSQSLDPTTPNLLEFSIHLHVLGPPGIILGCDLYWEKNQWRGICQSPWERPWITDHYCFYKQNPKEPQPHLIETRKKSCFKDNLLCPNSLFENYQSLYILLSFTSCCLCFEKNRLSPYFPNMKRNNITSVQLLSRVQLFRTPWTTACQASLTITNSQSLPKLMSIE